MSEETARPVFRLENALHDRSGAVQDFEGPLDLILFLLSRNKLEIQDISIAAILDQYLAWIQLRQSLDLEVASEFITMASRLLVLKTRMLLSIQDEETQNEMDALLQSLEERRRSGAYARVAAAAVQLGALGEFGRNILTRPPEPQEGGVIYTYDHKPSDLLRAMAALQDRAERALPPPRAAFREIVQREPYPVEQKAAEILTLLEQQGTVTIEQLFQTSGSRSEVVATFLAVLELCRANAVLLIGDDRIWSVQKTETGPQELS